MDWTDFVGFLFSVLLLVIGGAAGWAGGSEINQAKAYNLFISPFTKKKKMVLRLTGTGFDERSFVVDRPLGSEPIVIKRNKTTITKFPREAFNKSSKNVVIAQFDDRDIVQIPLEASSVIAETVTDKDGRILGYRYVENERVTRNWVSSDGVQNILINAIQWSQARAKGEINDDFKKLKKFLYIIAFVSIVALVVGLLNAKFGSDALNLLGGLKSLQTNTTVLTFPPA